MKILEYQLLEALAITELDFRLTSTLAKELSASEEEVREILLNNEAIRRPILARDDEQDYHRLVNRGLTKKEKLRFFIAVAAREVR